MQSAIIGEKNIWLIHAIVMQVLSFNTNSIYFKLLVTSILLPNFMQELSV